MSSASGSPSKGKAKEEESWQLGWWGLQPLLEPEDRCASREVLLKASYFLKYFKRFRPVVWSHAGTIFTAHATQPYVLGRLFPSSRQFMLEPPAPIYTNLSSYEPPTVISLSPSTSPRTQLLFAYFPSRNEAGVCCLWMAGPEVDTWIVRDFWTCARGAGVVASTWLGQPREVRITWM